MQRGLIDPNPKEKLQPVNTGPLSVFENCIYTAQRMIVKIRFGQSKNHHLNVQREIY